MPSCDGAAEETHLGAETCCPLWPWQHHGETQGTGWTGKGKAVLTTYPTLYLFVLKIIFGGGTFLLEKQRDKIVSPICRQSWGSSSPHGSRAPCRSNTSSFDAAGCQTRLARLQPSSADTAPSFTGRVLLIRTTALVPLQKISFATCKRVSGVELVMWSSIPARLLLWVGWQSYASGK